MFYYPIAFRTDFGKLFVTITKRKNVKRTRDQTRSIINGPRLYVSKYVNKPNLDFGENAISNEIPKHFPTIGNRRVNELNVTIKLHRYYFTKIIFVLYKFSNLTRVL